MPKHDDRTSRFLTGKPDTPPEIDEAQKRKLEALAKSIVDNPDRDPRLMIGRICRNDAEIAYMEAHCEKLEQGGADGRLPL